MRDPIVSISKGIAIILMVLGHTISTSSAVGAFIYMFHVPLFIFASGYCFKEHYINDVLTFVKRRVKGLWWPFFKYNCLFLAFHNYFLSTGVYDQTVVQYFTLPQHITKVLHFALMYDSEMLLGAFCFLNTLMGGGNFILHSPLCSIPPRYFDYLIVGHFHSTFSLGQLCNE